MNELIEEIKDWFRDSTIGKCIGFVLLFYTINSIIWGFVEPLTIDYNLISHYSSFHYAGVFFLTVVGLIIFLKKKTITTINFESLGNGEENTWITKEGNPERELKKDGVLGNYIAFKGTFHDYSEFKLDGVASTGSSLRVIYNPRDQFILYAKVTMSTKNGKERQEGWFALLYNIRTPYKQSDHEWAYPIKFKVIENTWLSSKVNLKKATKKTFGKSGWKYDHIIGLRVRGKGCLHEIGIY